MQPETDRSRAIVDRVVAWHNRHPLAQRIAAAQVQGVGVVSLPFAVQGAVVAPLPQDAPAAADPGPAGMAAGVPAASAHPDASAADDAASANAPASLDAGADVELVTDAEVSVLPPGVPPAPGERPQASAVPPPPAEGDEQSGRATFAHEASAQASQAAHALQDLPSPPAAPEALRAPVTADPLELRRQVTLPARPALPPWQRVWSRWRRRPVFRALFSEDFIAPLRPSRIGRWAADQGVAEWPLDAGAPLRQVALDPALRRPGDPAPELDLHLISAAVELDGRRKRLLISPAPGGPIIGPRHFSRTRMAGAAAVPLSLALIGAFVGVLGARTPGSSADFSSAAASAARSAVPAAAMASAAPVALAAAQVPVASAAASARVARVATAASEARVAPAAPSAPSAPSAVPSAPVAVAAASSTPDAAARKPEPMRAAAPAEAAASRPVSVEPRLGRIELPPLVPRLVQTERIGKRPADLATRAKPAAVAPSKAYALATAPLADRAKSERAAAQLHAVALLQHPPMKAELMHAGGAWRAVFWPFASAADAEKVRLALADKGLRTVVIEF